MGWYNIAGQPIDETGFGNVARAPVVDAPPEPPTYAPTDLGADLGVWLDGQDGATLLLDGLPVDDGDPLGRWADKSGNNVHADQPDNSYQPARQDTAINGHRGVSTFGGSKGLVLAPPLGGLSQFEIWLVARSALSGTQVLYETYVAATVNAVQLYRTSGDYNATVYGGSGQLNQAVLTDGGAAARIFRHRVDTTLASGGSGLEVDGSTAGVTHPSDANLGSSTMAANNLFLGARGGVGTLGVDGALGELVIVRRLLTSGEAADLLAYLQTRWSLLPQGINMPNNGADAHPLEPDPPETLRSLLERITTIEERSEEQHYAIERGTQAQESQARTLVRLADEQHRQGEVQAKQGRHLESIDLSLGVIARDSGARAQQDSVHDAALAAHDQKLATQQTALDHLRALATWKNAGKGSVGLVALVKVLEWSLHVPDLLHQVRGLLP